MRKNKYYRELCIIELCMFDRYWIWGKKIQNTYQNLYNCKHAFFFKSSIKCRHGCLFDFPTPVIILTFVIFKKSSINKLGLGHILAAPIPGAQRAAEVFRREVLTMLFLSVLSSDASPPLPPLPHRSSPTPAWLSLKECVRNPHFSLLTQTPDKSCAPGNGGIKNLGWYADLRII